MFLFKDYITEDMCDKHEDFVYVFGDNLAGWGRGGQAIIRYKKNSFGIPTKREPTMSPAAFFSDSSSEILSVKSDLEKLDKMSDSGKVVVLPTNPVGSGLAKLDKYSPVIYKIICDWWDSKPRIYTGNFSSLKQHKDKVPIAITRITPRWMKDVKEDKRLSPKLSTLMNYKKGKITDTEYIFEFDKVLNELLPMNIVTDILNDNDDKVLVCYCGNDKFCHRHLVAEWLEDKLDITINEVGKERIKRKLGRVKED
jgi:hypothetical protein